MRIMKTVMAITMSLCLVLGLSGCDALTFDRSQAVKDAIAQRDVSAMMSVAEADEAPFYVLLVGNDSRVGTVEISKPSYADGVGRSDTMMLVRVDPINYQLTIVSIPRDTRVDVNGAPVKINDIYGYYGGIERLSGEITTLTGIAPKYYIDTGFVGFENLVDALGGCQAYVPIEMGLADIVSGEYIELPEGNDTLTGAESLVLARVRKIFPTDQDVLRQQQDRQIIADLILQVAANPSGTAESVQALLDNTETNWPKDKLLAMVSDFVRHADQITIYSTTGPYEGDIDEASGLWLTYRDEAKWREIMDVVDAGGDPKGILREPTIEEAFASAEPVTIGG